MVEHFQMSFDVIFGDFAKKVFYNFDVVFTIDSIEKNGFIDGSNFAVIRGVVVDEEKMLKKYHCDEGKWNNDFYQHLIENNSKKAIEYFKKQKNWNN